MRMTRRRLLAAGAVGATGALAACTPASPTRSSSPSSPSLSRSSVAPTTPPPVSPSATGSSAAGVPWSQLARSLSGELVQPGATAYPSLRKTPNERYDSARPLALAEVASATDVATALAFAADHAVPVALRSGGHAYDGFSAGSGRLVIDLRRLAGISWSGTRVTMGPGRHLADVYSGLAARGRAVPGGSCPTVGLGGLSLGGGVGVLTRAYGLTCDHLVSAEVVLPSGKVVTASAASDPDLFWALRGGGGIGVVASLTYDTVAAPTITTTYLTWPVKAAYGDLLPTWFSWISGADPRLWSTLKILSGKAHPDGASVGATVTWTGPSSGFDAALAPILATRPTGRFDHAPRSFLATMQAYAGTGARSAFAATSNVAYAPVTAQSAIESLVSIAAGAPSSLQEAGISIDALGGHVGDLGAADTAFVHRKALATVQYTATYDAGTPSLSRRAAAYASDFRDRTVSTFGDHAYVNYLDPTLTPAAYFGANASRLARVRTTYDPHGQLARPQ